MQNVADSNEAKLKTHCVYLRPSNDKIREEKKFCVKFLYKAYKEIWLRCSLIINTRKKNINSSSILYTRT